MSKVFVFILFQVALAAVLFFLGSNSKRGKDYDRDSDRDSEATRDE